MTSRLGDWSVSLAPVSSQTRCLTTQSLKRIFSKLALVLLWDSLNAYSLGAPHSSNEGYAYAKRMCEVQCKAYREQYGDDFICVVPTNLYGKYDSYGEDKSHVVPALIKKAVLAKTKGESMIVLGTGKPLRQFCYTPDLAKLILWVLF